MKTRVTFSVALITTFFLFLSWNIPTGAATWQKPGPPLVVTPNGSQWFPEQFDSAAPTFDAPDRIPQDGIAGRETVSGAPVHSLHLPDIAEVSAIDVANTSPRAVFGGLLVQVVDAGGQPADSAQVRVETTQGGYVRDGHASTDASGVALLDLPPGDYNITAYSSHDHFRLHQYDVTSPCTVTLSAVGTPAIELTAKRRDGVPLDQADVNVVLSSTPLHVYTPLGQTDSSGQMTLNLTSGVYDVIVFSWTDQYDLIKTQQEISGTGGVWNFDASLIPTAEIVVSHPGVDNTDLTLWHPRSRLYGLRFSDMEEGARVILAANETYSAVQDVHKTDPSGAAWIYHLCENRLDTTFAPDEVFTFTVGGMLSVTGRTTPAHIGDTVSVADYPLDDFGSSLTAIYTETEGSVRHPVLPRITVSDPDGRVLEPVSDFSPQWYAFPFTVTLGTYSVHYEWDTGPYQSLLVEDSEFEVKPLATSALIPTSGGTLTSTFDDTSYVFPAGTFTSTVVVTHTVRFPDATLFPAGLAGIAHAFDVTATFSDTDQLARPTQPYTVTVRYTDNERAQVVEETLALYFWDNIRWVEEPSSVVSTAGNTVTVTPAHCFLWAVLGKAPRVFLPLVLR